jgi:hypothetical protein
MARRRRRRQEPQAALPLHRQPQQAVRGRADEAIQPGASSPLLSSLVMLCPVRVLCCGSLFLVYANRGGESRVKLPMPLYLLLPERPIPKTLVLLLELNKSKRRPV